MKLTKTFALAALVAGSLFAGTALQAQNSTNTPPAGEKHPGGPGGFQGRPGGGEAMAKELNLSEDQKAKVQAAMADVQKQMRSLRENTSLSPEEKRAKATEIRNSIQNKMQEILTADQYEKWQKHMQQHRPPGGAGGGSGGNQPPKQN